MQIVTRVKQCILMMISDFKSSDVLAITSKLKTIVRINQCAIIIKVHLKFSSYVDMTVITMTIVEVNQCNKANETSQTLRHFD